MKKCFIFCHGFGFDKNFWKNLSPYFLTEQFIYLDLGYFGEKFQPTLPKSNLKYIGIGHSLGLMKLLNLDVKFDCLIGLNSFVNFLGDDKLLHQERANDLQILIDHFTASPIITLKNFYKRCGVYSNDSSKLRSVSIDQKKIDSIDEVLAVKDLRLLANKYNIPDSIPTLIIGSKNDLIVPPKILYDNFSNYPNVTIKILDGGMHALGFLETNRIYNEILGFLNDTE